MIVLVGCDPVKTSENQCSAFLSGNQHQGLTDEWGLADWKGGRRISDPVGYSLFSCVRNLILKVKVLQVRIYKRLLKCRLLPSRI